VFKEIDSENRASIKNEIIRLSNLLDKQFAAELNFRNHCYLRIAYDNSVKNKWDNLIAKPFIKNAKEAQLKKALELLNHYVLDKQLLLEHNNISLKFRR
jgi:hypothetical protein